MLSYIPKNLVTTVRTHEEPGHRGPGSVRNPVILSYIPKNLVTTVRAHKEPGHRGPGSIKTLLHMFVLGVY